MNHEGDILLLADPVTARRFAAGLDGEQVVCHTDPFDALLELGRRRWPAVVLAAANPAAREQAGTDFAGLCRAARRLQKHARLFAVCTVAQEPEMRELLGRPLDDYFIEPLGRGDLDAIHDAAWRTGESAAAAHALPPRQVAELLDATHSVEALEAAIADAVGRAAGGKFLWLDEADLPPGAAPLLLAAGPTVRVLVPAAGGAYIGRQAEALLGALQACVPALLAAARRAETLQKLAVTDELTGSYNRRYFYARTNQILARAAGEGIRVALLLYDIDNFKRYNDTYGHAAGDEILRETAAMMKGITRSHDIVARIGGDEFAVLFCDPRPPRAPGSRPPTDAYVLADRFRKAVTLHQFPSLGPDAKGVLTISGGLAKFPDEGADVRELLRSADRALRAAKASGKNAIHLIGE